MSVYVCIVLYCIAGCFPRRIAFSTVVYKTTTKRWRVALSAAAALFYLPTSATPRRPRATTSLEVTLAISSSPYITPSAVRTIQSTTIYLNITSLSLEPGLGPVNTRYKRSLDAILKQRSGRRNFVRPSLSEFDSESESELSEIFWEAVSAAAIPQELLDAPLTQMIPPTMEDDEEGGEVEREDNIAEPPKNMSSQSRSTTASTWDGFLATVD